MHVFAYIDAGTGSMFIQAIIGVVLAGSVVLRSFIAKAFSKIRVVARRKTVNEEI